MSFLGQTLHNPLSTLTGDRHPTGSQRGRWVALLLLLVLVPAGSWAWRQFRSTDTVTAPVAAPVVSSATNSSQNRTTTGVTQPVAQTQPVIEKAPLSTPAQQPTAIPVAAAAITTTRTTQSLVVIAGTDGATLLTAPDGEQIATLEVGALLNATGRRLGGGDANRRFWP